MIFLDSVILISSDEAGSRLDRVIRSRFPNLKQGQLEKLLRLGKIRVDTEKVKAGQRVKIGQKIEFKIDLDNYFRCCKKKGVKPS